MAKIRFTPIPVAALQTNMGAAGFSFLAANDLAGFNPDTDGWDAIVQQLAADVDAGFSALSALSAFSLTLDVSADPVVSPQWSDAVLYYSYLAPQAGAQFSSAMQVLGSATATAPAIEPPAPVQPPVYTAPVHGGGGGGGTPPPPSVITPAYVTNYGTATAPTNIYPITGHLPAKSGL